MTRLFTRTAARMALAATAATLLAGGVSSAASAAVPAGSQILHPASVAAGHDDSWNYSRDRYDRHYRDSYGERDYGDRYRSRSWRDGRDYRETRAWRGRDGRTYCRRKDGTTGLIIGGAAGALLGREIDGGYNRTLGTILGAAGGALLGREVERGGSRCR